MLETIKRLSEGKITAWWEAEQLNPKSNSYEDCIFVRIGEVSENRWYRFFGDDIDDLPAEIIDMADRDREAEYASLS